MHGYVRSRVRGSPTALQSIGMLLLIVEGYTIIEKVTMTTYRATNSAITCVVQIYLET